MGNEIPSVGGDWGGGGTLPFSGARHSPEFYSAQRELGERAERLQTLARGLAEDLEAGISLPPNEERLESYWRLIDHYREVVRDVDDSPRRLRRQPTIRRYRIAHAEAAEIVERWLAAYGHGRVGTVGVR